MTDKKGDPRDTIHVQRYAERPNCSRLSSRLFECQARLQTAETVSDEGHIWQETAGQRTHTAHDNAVSPCETDHSVLGEVVTCITVDASGQSTESPAVGRADPARLDRTHYYDQEAVEAFWNAWGQDVGPGRLRTAGRRLGDGRGNHRGGWGRDRRDRAVAIILAELRQAGGYRRGMAARLIREHSGGERSWQRAMTEARVQYEREQAAVRCRRLRVRGAWVGAHRSGGVAGCVPAVPWLSVSGWRRRWR
ncbi:hypothetical protein ACFU5D_37090 [Streptomyces anthocyanicus]|uniref:hypothetical protein n=1 Tax=Streptomyces anthocyanicus TaxID=68174 RepID=UPI00365F0ED1